MDRTISNASQLSAIVKGRRKERNVSQADAGALISVTQGRYSQLESQIGELSLGRVLVLLRHLGLEMVVREAGAVQAKDVGAVHAVGSAAGEAMVKHQGFKIGEAIAALPTLGEINKKMSMSVLGAKSRHSSDDKPPSSKIKATGKPKAPPKGDW